MGFLADLAGKLSTFFEAVYISHIRLAYVAFPSGHQSSFNDGCQKSRKIHEISPNSVVHSKHLMIRQVNTFARSASSYSSFYAGRKNLGENTYIDTPNNLPHPLLGLTSRRVIFLNSFLLRSQ